MSQAIAQPNYIVAGFKSKVDAIKHIFEEIIKAPGCAGVDGLVKFEIWGHSYILKPQKKKTD